MLEFNLIGNIGTDITPQLVNDMLTQANGEDVTFYMASLGGSLSDGRTINGLIRNYKGKTRGVIIGDTASAGTIAILGCNVVDCDSNTPFLIHNSWIPEGGNANDLRKKAANLDMQDKTMIAIYKNRTGLPEFKIAELMAKEDWLLPEEAKEYGFIDNIIESKYKVAAYFAEHGNISSELLTKLKNKMKLPFKKEDKAKVLNTLALKDGKNLLINAEETAIGVEVAPLGAMTLDDGSYELADGRTIVISGGVITEVKEPEPEMSENETSAIVEAVGALVVSEIEKVKTEIREEVKAEFSKISSQHTPPKGKETTPVKKPEMSVQSKVKAVTDGIFNEIKKSRKA